MVQDYVPVEKKSDVPKIMTKKRLRRDLSKIGVANYDLDTVIETVRVIRASGIERSTMKILAEKASITEKFSTFATKVYAAAKYQLLDVREIRSNEPREIVLLPLSDRILDPQTERQAKVEAFLNVPLNRALYSRFEGRPLPDDSEINRIMRDELGVSPGVLDSARQTLKRAARQAGMFERHRDQMSVPEGVSLPDEENRQEVNTLDAYVAMAPVHAETLTPPDTNEITLQRAQADGLQADAIPRVINDLWQEFQRGGARWDSAQRDEWLEIFSRSMRFFYRGKP